MNILGVNFSYPEVHGGTAGSDLVKKKNAK
jgi:hypothetical protein